MSANPNLVRPDCGTLVQWLAELSDNQLAKRLGCTSPTIALWRDHYGLPRSQAKSAGNIKWQTDRAYFSQIDTPEKAYVLGLLIADGHVNKSGYKVEVSLKESDAGLLRLVGRALNCDAPLGWMTNHLDGSRMRRLNLCGKQLVGDLLALGVRHDKSVSATYPAVPAELEGHLVRGIWDGEGSIASRQMELIGTSAVLDGVCAASQRHTGCVLRRRMSGKGNAYHYAYGTRRDADVLHWMYSGATIALARKQEAYVQYWS
jgi:hypothetical protein